MIAILWISPTVGNFCFRLSAIDKNSTISARVCARESQGRVYKKFMIANGIPQKINI